MIDYADADLLIDLSKDIADYHYTVQLELFYRFDKLINPRINEYDKNPMDIFSESNDSIVLEKVIETGRLSKNSKLKAYDKILYKELTNSIKLKQFLLNIPDDKDIVIMYLEYLIHGKNQIAVSHFKIFNKSENQLFNDGIRLSMLFQLKIL